MSFGHVIKSTQHVPCTKGRISLPHLVLMIMLRGKQAATYSQLLVLSFSKYFAKADRQTGCWGRRQRCLCSSPSFSTLWALLSPQTSPSKAPSAHMAYTMRALKCLAQSCQMPAASAPKPPGSSFHPQVATDLQWDCSFCHGNPVSLPTPGHSLEKACTPRLSSFLNRSSKAWLSLHFISIC